LKKGPLFIDSDSLQAITDARTFRRGREYARTGRVAQIKEHDGAIEAAMNGTGSYRTRLWQADGKLRFSCSCPLGEEETCCKHVVALGLAWLGEGPPPGYQEEDPAASDLMAEIHGEELRGHLLECDKSDLVDILLEQALGDDRLMRRLLLETSRSRGQDVEGEALRAVIDDAVSHGGFVSWREAASYARGIEDVVDAIEGLLKAGKLQAVIELSEYALKAVEAQLDSIDDSDGEIRPIVDRLQDIHLRACKGARPDPNALAQKLLAWELHSEWDVFYNAVSTYADVLGPEGMSAYRGLAENEWTKVKPVGPGKRDASESHRRFRITSIMETLARQSGDLSKLVEVLSRDLSADYRFVQIAEECKKAGRDDLAVQWAEKGVGAFPDHTDLRLREFLAHEYHALDRHDEAMALMWAAFADDPRLELYKQLKAHAERSKAWPEWRDKAFAHLRAVIAAEKSSHRKSRWMPEPDNSSIVSILLWEKDVDGAWREAQTGGCSSALWLELAGLRERSHPADALPIYQRTIQPTLNRKNIDAYREAVRTLRIVHRLMKETGKGDDFTAYLEQVRAAHRQKRNFMKLLDQVQWH
jgi:uncharacterized Zn finger protein